MKGYYQHRPKHKYMVYDNKTDFPLVSEGTAVECAKACGIRLSSFYTIVSKCRDGIESRWHIEALKPMEEDNNA